MRLLLTISLIAAAALAVGCGGVPTTSYYMLEAADSPADVVTPRAGTSIGVRPFRVDPPYDQDRLVYRVGDDSPEVGFYAYHRWAAPLARMLPTVVAASLEGMPGVRSIEPVAPGRGYDLWLEGHVTTLEEVDGVNGPRVRLRLRLDLVDRDGAELWSRTLDGESPAPTDEVRVVVEHMNELLGGLVAGVRDDLARRVEDAAGG